MGTIRVRSISVSCTELPSPLVWLDRYLTGKAADDFGDATQALQDRVTGGGVGNPDAPLARLTDGAHRCDRDRSVLQQPPAAGRAAPGTPSPWPRGGPSVRGGPRRPPSGQTRWHR